MRKYEGMHWQARVAHASSCLRSASAIRFNDASSWGLEGTIRSSALFLHVFDTLLT